MALYPTQRHPERSRRIWVDRLPCNIAVVKASAEASGRLFWIPDQVQHDMGEWVKRLMQSKIGIRKSTILFWVPDQVRDDVGESGADTPRS